MDNQAIKELRKIIKIPDQKHFHRTKVRESALEDWINSWIVETEESQLVLNSKFFTTEFRDILKERLGAKIIDRLMEDMIHINADANKITATLVAIRRKKK